MSTPEQDARRPVGLRRGGRGESGAWTLHRWFLVASGVTALVAVLAVVLSANALMRITDARTVLYDHVAPATTAAQELTQAQLNQETGIRGYTLVPQAVFLEPYRAGVEQEADALRTLYAQAQAVPGSRLAAQITASAQAGARWRTEYAEPSIAAVAGGGTRPDPERGRQLFDVVRAQQATLVDAVEADRAAARASLESAISFLQTIGLVVAVIVLGFLGLAALALRTIVLRPLSRLALQTRNVVEGDITSRVKGSGPREIVELGADVEAMRAHIVREVRRLQEVNARLDEQTRDLERSNRDLEQFAYVASHDLQEPLRKVSSFCQLLQRRYGGQLDERADQYIGFAVDGAQRMQRLINDLLAFSRVGRTTAGFEPVELARVATDACAQLAPACEETNGRIELPERLPTVRGDAGLLRQLLVNLFGNGLKFHREGVPPVVALQCVRRGQEWELSVRDNGIGIEPEFSDKVFVIFQRLHGREVYEGTGIGLALAKKIVEFHAGRIWIGAHDDAPGTVVRFTLPVLPEPGDHPPAPDDANATDQPEDRLQKETTG